jgi:predicted DNA-binding WGR domain protein
MHIYLQRPQEENKPPRYYHLFLQRDLLGGWSLIREWGYQGAGGRVRREHHPTRQEAEAALLALRDDQLRRGYRVVFVQGERPPP